MIATLALDTDIRPRANPMRGLLAMLLTLYQRARQRRALAELDDRLLADIGLSREQTEREARKPFWCS